MTNNLSMLNAIRGRKVIDTTLDIGDAGIEFDNGTQIAIYNTFDVTGKKSVKASDLLGCVVIDVKESEALIEIFFENNVTISIDMTSNAFTGPEAMQLIVPGESIVVWS